MFLGNWQKNAVAIGEASTVVRVKFNQTLGRSFLRVNAKAKTTSRVKLNFTASMPNAFVCFFSF